VLYFYIASSLYCYFYNDINTVVRLLYCYNAIVIMLLLCLYIFIVEFAGRLVSWNDQSQWCGHQF